MRVDVSTPAARAVSKVLPDTALRFGNGQGGWQGRGERMNDGRFVYAVEFQVMHHDAIGQGGPGRR